MKERRERRTIVHECSWVICIVKDAGKRKMQKRKLKKYIALTLYTLLALFYSTKQKQPGRMFYVKYAIGKVNDRSEIQTHFSLFTLYDVGCTVKFTWFRTVLKKQFTNSP